MSTPPRAAIEIAMRMARRSPCAKSKRGAAIWEIDTGVVVGHGCNAPPPGVYCDGTVSCRAACGKICEHTEAAAIRMTQMIGRAAGRLDLLHVKAVDGELVASGGPSCWQCSKAILACFQISGVWLFHEDGWRRYEPAEFHELTMQACGLPCVRRFQSG